MRKVVIIGGGAGGMLAAGRAAECGAKVILLEKNSILGKKLRITGKGRCNLTNTADLHDFVNAFGKNGKFLYGAFSRFSNNDLRDLMKRLGVPTKVERGGRVFPVSDQATDVAEALHRWLRELKVDIRLGTRAQEIVLAEETAPNTEQNGEMESKSKIKIKSKSIEYPASPPQPLSPSPTHPLSRSPLPLSPSPLPLTIQGVRVFGGIIPADAVVLATGGITYPKTGSTGDGYEMASKIGHKIVTPHPSLTALEVKEEWVHQLQGLSLKNIKATLYADGKKIASEFGEMLFTHFGVSGPIILTLSKTYASLKKTSDVYISINLKPAVSREQLDERLINDFNQTKYFKTYAQNLVPRTLIPVFLHLLRINFDTPLNRITAPQRKRIIDLLHDFRLTIEGIRSEDEAIVTAGGIPISEIEPRTMESKLVKGLYFCGEVIDIDAITGGFNLQAAFSTGWVAGECAAGV